MSCSVVDGFKHAFPGRLLHYAGGEKKTENAQFPFPEGFCGTSRTPYHDQKRVGAAKPQREIKSQEEGRAADRCTETERELCESALRTGPTSILTHSLRPKAEGEEKRNV